MIYLQKYGISTKLAAKIYQYYGMKVYKVLEEIRISLQIILKESDLRLRMKLHPRLAYIQIQTIVYEVVYFRHLQQAVGEGHVYLHRIYCFGGQMHF